MRNLPHGPRRFIVQSYHNMQSPAQDRLFIEIDLKMYGYSWALQERSRICTSGHISQELRLNNEYRKFRTVQGEQLIYNSKNFGM